MSDTERDSWDFVFRLIEDPFGRWIVLVGVIVLAAFVSLYVFGSIRKRLKALGEDLGVVKHEVKNDHPTNLRVESDVRHEENTSKLDTALEMIANMQRSLGRVYDKVDSVEKSVGVLTGRVTTLEDTTPGRPTGRHRED